MATIADSLWLPIIVNIYERLHTAFPEVLPLITLPETFDNTQRLMVLGFMSVVFVVLNYMWTRQQILPPTSVSQFDVDSPFPKKDYVLLRNEFCRSMLARIGQYDDDVNWSDVDYTTLEAEVELDQQGAQRPQVERDLVAAIRRDHTSRAFLLLGDPGSGKSVSLRRLCRELYEEVEKTGIVPVYVNLREWDGPYSPSDHDIEAFIRKYMKQEAGRAGGRFLNEWYESMLEHGRFFFLLDSFDEMPAVLDCDDASPKIKEISRAFDRFFHDIHNCRGVLASRRFRQPRGFRGRRLSIRPFKEAQIRDAMARWLIGQALDRDELIRQIFRRPDLTPAIRNPFLADLITHYVIHNHGTLPPSQFAIYDRYIHQRLEDDATELKELSIDPEVLIEAAMVIAWAMYNTPDIGLDVDLNRLRTLVQLTDFDTTISALRITRIARIGGVRSQNFSFVHRRFAEFFVVRAMMMGAREVPLEAIPEDSRWRDCMVVYCGVAPEDKVRPVADFCWSIIKHHSSDFDDVQTYKARPAIHSLRFLRDAFLGRSAFLAGFHEELSQCILRWIRGTDLIAAKVAAEALGLLSPKDRSEGIVQAFGRESLWIKETALRACRHLRDLEAEAKQAIRQYVRTLPVLDLLRSYPDLSFGFSLSEDLRFQRWGLRLDIASIMILWLSLLVMIIHPKYRWFGLFCFLIAMIFEVSTAFYPAKMSPWNRQVYRPHLDSSLRFVEIGSFISLAVPLILIYVYIFLWKPGPFKDLPVSDWKAFSIIVVEQVITFSLVNIVLSPWELWLHLPEMLRWIKGLWSLRTLVFCLFWMVLVGLLYYFREGVNKALWIAYYLVVIAVVIMLGFFIRELWKRTSDRMSLRRLVIPDQVDRPWVYQICRSLRTSAERRRFLEILRLRNVDLTDEPGPQLVYESWLDHRVQESLAKLESVWLGLEE
jgi:hypothetical protein